MARQEIDLTTPQPNGKMGEPTKAAWEKVNDMTAELYADVGAISGISGPNGASVVGYKSNLANSIQSDLYKKASDLVSIKSDFGAVGDGVANDWGSVQNAVQGTPPNQVITAPPGIYKMDADVANDYGKAFVGGGAILAPFPGVSGAYNQVNTYTDNARYFFGKNYLYRVYKRLDLGGLPIKCFTFGDSTIEGAVRSGPYGDGPSVTTSGWIASEYMLQNYLPQLARRKGLRVPLSVTNMGVGGSQWSDLNAIPSLSPDTDLFIIKYGINDGGNPVSTRLDTLKNTMRAKLAAIRSSTYGSADNLSIVLIGPNSLNNVSSNRDYQWIEQLRGIYMQAAKDFDCMYFDPYAYMQDTMNAAGYWMDNPFGNGQCVHPMDLGHAWIWGALFDFMFPQSECSKWLTNHVENLSSIFPSKNFSDAPSTYPLGVSMHRALASSGWPIDGMVVTHRQADNVVLQENIPFAQYAAKKFIRVANTAADGWNRWTGQFNTMSLQASWVAFGGGFSTPAYSIDVNGYVHLKGLIKSGTTSSGTVIATLPEGLRPSEASLHLVTTSTGTASLRVQTNGNIEIDRPFDSTWTSLSGVIFPSA